MKENKIIIIINRPIDDVFEFTTNPNNTHLWIPFIKEEICNQYPPKIGSKYRNRGYGSDNWDVYEVLAFKKNEKFLLTKDYYFVKYSYRVIDQNTTEMEYFEWIISKNGSLENTFTKDILENLKYIMENENIKT